MATPTLRELVEPRHTALLLVELQEGVVGTTSALPQLAEAASRTGLVERAAVLASAARGAGVPVVHCTAENLPGGFGVNDNARLFAGARRAGALNAPGSAAVRPVGGLRPAAGDLVLPRYHGLSPLTGGPLDSLLRNQGVRTVVVAGVSLNVAVPNVVFDAVNRSYQAVVAEDAVVGVPVEYGRQVLQQSLALVATLVSTGQIGGCWASAVGRAPAGPAAGAE